MAAGPAQPWKWPVLRCDVTHGHRAVGGAFQNFKQFENVQIFSNFD
jgi:hypothetical protein